jgi:hypothetical protein
MTDDTLPAALAEIRERNEERIRSMRYTEYTVEHHVAEGDVRRLLAALEAVLKLHEGRDCRNCEPGTHRRCRLCDDWPCSTYEAIARALAGEEGDSD